jgi:deazaflavin-dependent oxidoreductase (nitroreductase family)
MTTAIATHGLCRDYGLVHAVTGLDLVVEPNRGFLMSASSPITGAAAGLLRARWLVRAPVWLYRARLGILLGSRFLMLEHTGRKSGARRHVVLEVVEHPSPGTYIVVSGFGDHAQWFRNIRANPQARVYTLSHGPAPATARILPQAEAVAALAAYSARHPRAWAAVRPLLRDTLGSPAGDVESRLPVIALELGRGH